ncbi:MAG: hypothetical protein ACRECF_02455 [Methyloceanibacter sp.]
MHWKDPNRPERSEPDRRDKRYLDSATGDAAKDGYTVKARRPRVSVRMTDIVAPDRADRIESAFGDMPDLD